MGSLGSRLWSAIAVALLVSLLAGCASQRDSQVSLSQSGDYYNFLLPSFEAYVKRSRQWLTDNRSFISQEHEKELDMNAPYQLMPDSPGDKAILLVHGLGDSPFTFSDLSRTLVKQGFVVQVLLLPGHGSKPEDLMLPTYEDWQDIVDHYAGQLKARYEQVWLGGFSTGANLVTIHAQEYGNVDGLLLFSPGFQSQAGYWEKLTPLMASMFDWGWRARETNLAKYSSSPINGALAYTRSAEVLRSKLQGNKITIPTLLVISEADSVIDTASVKDLFNTRFEHTDNHLIWYGETPQQAHDVEQISMQLPLFRISTGSHMSVMFKPCNSYYGIKGEKRICENGFSRHDKSRCESAEQVWYSAWGHNESDKLHARLTWNPHYAHLGRSIARITLASD